MRNLASVKRMVVSRLWAALTVISVIALWCALTYTSAIDRVFLPTPGEVVSSLLGLFNLAFFRDYLLPSLFRVMAAFVLSVAVAFPLGVLSSQIALVERMVHPVAAFSRYLPVAAFVPLCILWFGIDDAQKIAVVVALR